MKERILNSRNLKKLLSIVLAVVMTVTLIPMRNITVNAEELPTCNHSSWTPWGNTAEEKTSMPTVAGNYYLVADVIMNGLSWVVPGGTTNLCLNGHMIVQDDTVKTIQLGYNTTEDIVLNIFDCKPETEHKGYYFEEPEEGDWGTWKPLSEEDSLESNDTLYGGLIVGYKQPTIEIDNYEVEKNTTLNLYGGTITGGQCSGAYASGGGVGIMSPGCTFNMYGGCITKNSAESSNDLGLAVGGGVYVQNNGCFNMYGGEITKNMAQYGGGVFVDNTSTFVATGGSITDNMAVWDGDGAGVYVANALFYYDEWSIGQWTEGDPYLETCLAAGTPITLANGTRTAIENLSIGDEVRVFNHETGEISTSKLFDLWKFPEKKEDAFTLHFTNGIDVTAVGGHCFFEKEANKYVNITKECAESFIGHKFYNADAARWETLESVTFLDEAVDTYIIVSEKTFNTLANGMLSNVDGLYSKLCNIFDMDEKLKIDAAKKAAEIEQYGLWDYDGEHFTYVTEETYEALNLCYLGVAIGKGVITPEELEEAAENTLNYNPDLVKPEMLPGFAGGLVYSAAPAGTDPGIYLGGSVQITGNYIVDLFEENDPVESNLFVSGADGAIKVTLLDAITTMKVGVTLKARNEDYVEDVESFFSNNGAAGSEQYFKADNSDYFVRFRSGHLYLLEKHNHGEWDYSASGATLVAECKAEGNCDLTDNKASLTLKADSVYYLGSTVSVTLGTAAERAAWEAAGLTVPTTIKYEKADGTALTAAPTTEGSYVAKVSPVGVTASAANTAKVSFTIQKKVEYYEDVKTSSGEVKDITGTEEAPKETNHYSAAIKNSSELEALLDVAAADKAQGVNVWIELVDAKDTMPAADKTLIEKAAGTKTVGVFLDASLFKKVGDNEAEKVHELKGKIKVSLVVPEDLRKEGRTYGIIRVHDGVATAIEGTFDAATHTFTFETDRFSSYALTYADASSNVTPPKTGDVNMVWVYMFLLLGTALIAVAVYRKKRF